MAGTSHGNTPAAWTGVIISFIGFCVAGAFVVVHQPAGFWAGMAIAVLGGVAGLVMRGMGLGAPKSEPLKVTETPAHNREAVAG
ncbi:HGxxPAAW family protein [Streptomyces sp. MS06]|uniref:HGxxPAAW family protein n=1 Tax=Streptomyces sp. MS06 TaxID=3385974 RepID=UPI0039A0D40C